MAGALSSQFRLAVEISDDAAPAVTYRTPEAAWTRRPGPPPEEQQSDAVWNRVLRRWSRRRDVLEHAGRELGEWLYGDEVLPHLVAAPEGSRTTGIPQRIELSVPLRWSDWPWELAALEGHGALGTHPGLTVVRVGRSPHQLAKAPGPPLKTDLVGVTFEGGDDRPALSTSEEVEELRKAIEQAGRGREFAVAVDPEGEWRKLGPRWAESVPDIFHFAGHGLPEGRGLEFRSGRGTPQSVSADQLAAALTPRKGGLARLAFLNACHTGGTRRPLPGTHRPYAGVAHKLIEHGIAAVIGQQTPVADHSARSLATTFYADIARGADVDCAAQSARRVLHRDSGDAVAWAFLTATARVDHGHVARIFTPGLGGLDASPVAALDVSLFKRQRHDVEVHLLKRRPAVAIVHGADRTGQRFVVDRIHRQLRTLGRVVYKPVARMRWSNLGDPAIQRSQVLGAIAQALGIPTGGAADELERTVARAFADRCRQDRVLVIDIIDVFRPKSEAQAKALSTLVKGLWVDLVEQASRHRTDLPVFLLVPVAHVADRGSSRRATWTREIVGELAETRRISRRTRVLVLPELQQIEVSDVADFLEEAVDMGPDEADKRADYLARGEDNETILAALEQLLTACRQR